MTGKAGILVVSAVASDADLIRNVLHDEYENIFLSTEPDQAVQDFDDHKPQVLLLAFRALEEAEQFYLGLYRRSACIHNHPHRALVLCNKNEVPHAYELCKRNYFDDYIVFWTITHDAQRLAMAVHHALRELSNIRTDMPGVEEFALQARHVAELESCLDHYVTTGEEHMESARRTLERTGRDIGTALDRAMCRLPGFDPGRLDGGPNRAVLQSEMKRIGSEEIARHIEKLADAMRPMHEWACSLKQALEPQIESARTLGELANRVQPLVLVVDDDEFQHQLLSQILADQNIELSFAKSSIEGLAILRRRRPDLILMDVNLPDVDGIQATRHIKSVEQLAGIPVIMITGRSGKDTVLDSVRAGASDFVVKPFDRSNLVGKIWKLIAASTGDLSTR